VVGSFTTSANNFTLLTCYFGVVVGNFSLVISNFTISICNFGATVSNFRGVVEKLYNIDWQIHNNGCHTFAGWLVDFSNYMNTSMKWESS
jgi:hypothetical protein